MGKVGLDAKETCRIPDDSGRKQRIAEVSIFDNLKDGWTWFTIQFKF